MQNDFCSRGGWFDSLGVDTSPVRRLYEPINCAIKAVRARQIPDRLAELGCPCRSGQSVPGHALPFHRVGCGAGLGDTMKGRQNSGSAPSGILEKDAWGAAVVDELDSHSDDIFVDKHRISGFWDTPLDSVLRTLGVKIAAVCWGQCGSLRVRHAHGRKLSWVRHHPPGRLHRNELARFLPSGDSVQCTFLFWVHDHKRWASESARREIMV